MRIKKRLMLMACMAFFAMSLSAAEGDSTKIQNPMLWADVPDPDVIRVGDTFYLVSTTMHLMPGAPVMVSQFFKSLEAITGAPGIRCIVVDTR